MKAFYPQGNTILIASTAAAATLTQLSTAGGYQGALLVNRSTNDAFIAVGKSTATAVIPTTATPGTGMCLAKNTSRTISVPPDCFISALTSAGQADIFITPGYGG